MKHLNRLVSATALAAALATAACKPGGDASDGNAQAQMALPALPATLPLEAGAATEIAPAPSASDLPDAPELKLARVADTSQAYGYADAAYNYDEALGDAPPDYGFDYEGSDPWAWQGYDDSLMVAEPIDDGYRYYYYRPGADEPYFVRDPFYSYGYANGLLAVVYGADGGIVPYADYGPRLIYGSRYYARGRQLWGASRRAKRRPVVAANWVRQRPVIIASRDRWGAGRNRQPDWRRFAETDRPRQAAYWNAEQVRRRADARRFEGWREQGFRNAPPPRAIPVQWEKAKWARDDRRYRPAAEALKSDRKDERRDARQERQDARQDVQQQARREQRQAERQAQNDRPNRDQAQNDHRDAQQERQREQRQAERQQAQQQQLAQQRDARQQQQREAQQAQRQQRQAQQRDARQAQQREAQQAQRQQQQQAQQAQSREAQQAARQQQQSEARQAQQAQRREAQQTQRREAQQTQRQERQAEARQAQQAERQQAQQAARQQAQAERQQAAQAQRQQAQQAARQQQQAERQQAAQAQRQQAQQAERQQQQARQREQQQAQRQQMQQQRQQQQQQRQERREARGQGPN